MFKYNHPILFVIGVLIMYGYWTISYHFFSFLVKHIGVSWLKRIRHLSIIFAWGIMLTAWWVNDIMDIIIGTFTFGLVIILATMFALTSNTIKYVMKKQ